jgi:hypothetical protein
MTKLNDIQLILLTSAATRDHGSLLPAPAAVADSGDRLTKAITSLAKRGLAEECLATDAASALRTHGDDRFGMFITDAGRAAINVEPDGVLAAAKSDRPVRAKDPKPERQTKSAAVVALLQRNEGATLAELVQATDWLPHTTRAALTGLKKKGHVIDKRKRDDVTCYHIAAKA